MRKDVFEGVFMAKKENLKINYSEIAKQYNFFDFIDYTIIFIYSSTIVPI